MDTGSDEGEPGGTTDTTPLTAEEQGILERLRDTDGPAVVTGAPEDSPAAGAAAEDGAPLATPPPTTTPEPDPLDPIFQEPTP